MSILLLGCAIRSRGSSLIIIIGRERLSIREIFPPLRRRIEAENWSLERFCLSEELRNLYQAFFWNFPIENFDFIGITESFDEDAAYFMERYFKKIKNKAIPKANANPDKIGKYSAKISPDFLKEIQEFHAEDYVLYRYALQRRAERISAGA